MTNEITPPGNDVKIRCPRLGHQIHFAYCRGENQGLPCFKALDCWHPHFPVEAFLRAELSHEAWERAFRQPSKPKVLSLLELIEQAQKAGREKKIP